jgi:hypothetical protein
MRILLHGVFAAATAGMAWISLQVGILVARADMSLPLKYCFFSAIGIGLAFVFATWRSSLLWAPLDKHIPWWSARFSTELAVTPQVRRWRTIAKCLWVAIIADIGLFAIIVWLERHV